MGESARQVDPMVAISRAHAALQDLHGLDLTALSEQALLALWRELERLRRRIPSVEHQLVWEVEARALPDAHHVRSTAQFLRALLRLDPREATGRVNAAHAGGSRRSVSTGAPMPAPFPAVAAAQATGAISERQARVITEAIERLPDDVRAGHGSEIEADLVEFADRFDPIHLGKLAERISAYYDPDGRLTDVDYRQRQRGITVRQRVDGSSTLTGELTAEATELLLTHFDALAAPRPEIDGVKDPRTAQQRRHDAFVEALQLNLRARQLPTAGGVGATVVLTMSAEQFEARAGLASTGHGALIPVPEAMRIAAADYRLMNVVIDKTKGITAYSSLQRCFSEAQRLAMMAADGPGCTFPECPIPAAWCQADHTIDHAQGGITRVDFGVLACRYHNNDAKKQGWRSTRINGRAAWIPPRWLDRQQTPRYNLLHNPNPPP